MGDIVKYRSMELCGKIKEISMLGIGMGCVQDVSDAELEHMVRHALVNGINYFDLCAGSKNVFAPVGRAVSNVRDKVLLQAHFGAGFDELNQYEWIRDFDRMRRLFDWQLKQLGTDYIDIGILHLVDDKEDMTVLRDSGILQYMNDLKESGALRSIGFSSHSPKIAGMVLDIGGFDVAMLPINVRQGRKDTDELKKLTERCMREAVCVEAVGVFGGGRFIDGSRVPGRKSFTKAECLNYPLSMPGVTSVVAGVRSIPEMDELLSVID